MTTDSKKFQSPLARARGLGSAHEGLTHWMMERVTSVALVPLTFWVVYSIVSLRGALFADFVAWLSLPWNAVLMLLFVIISFIHTALGLQVVIEDYVSCHATKLLMIIGVRFTCLTLAFLSVFSILRLAL